MPTNVTSSPLSQPSHQDGGRDAVAGTKMAPKVGMATCTKSQFESGRFPFIVKAPLALVLDRRDEAGKVLGVLQAEDVAIASDLKSPWIMLPSGSYVRFKKMRQGRIPLQMNGWMMLEHSAYGVLLGAISSNEVSELFGRNGFARLPIVKLPPEELLELSTPAPPDIEPGASMLPKAKSTATPKSRVQQPEESKSEVVEAPKAAAPMGPPAKAASPKPGLPRPAVPQPRAVVAKHAGVADAEVAKDAAKDAAVPSAEAGRDKRHLNQDSALSLLGELKAGYMRPRFADASRTMNASWSEGKKQSEKMRDVDTVCLKLVVGPIIERYGFSPDEKGMKQATEEIQEQAKLSSKVMEAHIANQKLVLSLFPKCFEPPSRAKAKAVAIEAAAEAKAKAVAANAEAKAKAVGVRAAFAKATPKWLPNDKDSSEEEEEEEDVKEDEFWIDHLHVCGFRHFEVVHKIVHVRAGPSLGARSVTRAQQGVFICSCSPQVPNSPKGNDAQNWVTLSEGALKWKSLEDCRPQVLLPKTCPTKEAYILMNHISYGPLLEEVWPPKLQPGVKQKLLDDEKKRRARKVEAGLSLLLQRRSLPPRSSPSRRSRSLHSL